MKTVAIQIVAAEDEEFVMNILQALEKKHLIELPDWIGLPGEPMTVEELNQRLEVAERSEGLTAEQARAFLGL